jgi:GPI mannosyltransferase 3
MRSQQRRPGERRAREPLKSLVDAADRLGPRVVAVLFALSLVLHIVAAHFGVGYYHPDEHFQVLEFAGMKLGTTPASALPWEFAARARPWLLPAFFRLLAGAWRTIGVESPFTWAESLRLIAGIVAWESHLALYMRARDWVDEPGRRTVMAALFALLWYFPFADVRTSSETFSSSFFLFAIVVATSHKRSLARALVMGVLVGLAFEFRFQTAILAVGLGAWLVFRTPWRAGRLLAAFAALALAIALGRVVDRWGYGDWTLSPWVYFRVNVLEHRAAAWGTSPVWGYFPLVARQLPPLGALAVLATLVAWWRQRGHVLTWVTLPFVLAHSLIGHKELRFLSPVAMVLPVLVVLALPSKIPRFFRAIAWLLAVEDVAALLVLTFAPLRPEFRAYQALYERDPEGGDVYYTGDADPFEQASLEVWVFRRPGVRLHKGEPPRGAGPALRWLTADEPFPAPGCDVAYRSLPPHLVAAVPAWTTTDIHNVGWDACE